MILGYARVSTRDQTMSLQLDALRQAGAERIYCETASGDGKRPEQAKVMKQAAPGDCVLVWKLDRWGRSLKDFIASTEELAERGIAFRSLTEPFATDGPAGKFIRAMLGAFAEFELNMIRERVVAGMVNAKAKGTHCGRPLRLTPEQITWIRSQLDGDDPPTVAQIAEWLDVSVPTVRHARYGTGPYTPGKPSRGKRGRVTINP